MRITEKILQYEFIKVHIYNVIHFRLVITYMLIQIKLT